MKMKWHLHGGHSALHLAALLICLSAPSDGLRIIPNGVSVRESDDVVLICRNNDGSYPTGGITWSGPSGATYGPNPGAQGDRVRASYHLLYINDVVPSDRGSYQCRDVVTGSRSPAILVVVTRGPTILNEMPVQPIYLHQTVLIRCEVDLGYPTSVVFWYKDGVIINFDSSTRLTKLSNGLQIRDVQQSDEGTYECYPRNEVGFDSLFIRVAFRAPPQFIHSTTNTTVITRKGGMVDLDCSAAGAPQPNYTWTIPPGSSGGQGSVSIGPVLRIQYSDTRDMGTYKCNVSNEFGAIQRTFNVTVFVPPAPILATLNRTVSLGHPVTLHCSVQAQPPPTYSWFHYNRRTISPITDPRYTPLQNGSLHISTLWLSDFNPPDCIMVLLCSAENAFGQSQQYYKVTPAGNECTQSVGDAMRGTTDSPSTLPVSTSASTASRDATFTTPQSVDEEQSKFEVPLIAAFAVIMFILGLVVLAVVVYLVVICRHKKRPPKTRVEDGNMHHPTAVRLHNPQLNHVTTFNGRVATQPPSPAILSPAVHTAIPTHSRASIDSNNSGIYNKLNRNIPNGTLDGNRLVSTSSTNSTQPLLPSSSVEEDNAFYDDIVVPEATIAQVCRCENCNCPIHINQSALNQPTYLQLREDTRNPSAAYETVS